MAKRNPAYGGWTEEETNWSERDTALLARIRRENPGSVPTSFKEIKEMVESLPTDEDSRKSA